MAIICEKNKTEYENEITQTPARIARQSLIIAIRGSIRTNKNIYGQHLQKH
jgi:hypothetical protein